MKALIYGENVLARKKTLEKIIGGAHKEHIYVDTYTRAYIENILSHQGLFGESLVVVAHDLLGKYAEELLPIVETSPHLVIFLEEKAPKDDIIESFDVSERYVCVGTTQEGKPFNIFSLSDALLTGNRKTLWLQLHGALTAQVSSEEIHRILLWQVKNMLLVLSSSGKTNLKPFVEKKARSGLVHFTKKKLEELSRELVTIHHRGRRGEPLTVLLEHTILTKI